MGTTGAIITSNPQVHKMFQRPNLGKTEAVFHGVMGIPCWPRRRHFPQFPTVLSAQATWGFTDCTNGALLPSGFALGHEALSGDWEKVWGIDSLARASPRHGLVMFASLHQRPLFPLSTVSLLQPQLLLGWYELSASTRVGCFPFLQWYPVTGWNLINSLSNKYIICLLTGS